ncbi:MAG TPA: NAD-dependent epimerase/dehydratase family protein, partial [Bacteroidetes bacterium]|nr:NAD-dependent epimerase/dehydratase family protein [Bacteroidota bacterium]
FINQALSGETLEIYGDGSQTRDFIYVNDLLQAVYLAATKENVGGEVFQIATNKETTVLEMTEMLVSILQEAGIDGFDLRHGEKRVGDVMRNFSDTRKANSLLSWRVKTNLLEGLEKTVLWFL